MAGIQRRTNHGADVLRPRRAKKQQFRFGRKNAFGGVQEQFAHAFSHHIAARLPGPCHVSAAFAQSRLQQTDLGRLPAAIRSLEGEEKSATLPRFVRQGE